MDNFDKKLNNLFESYIQLRVRLEEAINDKQVINDILIRLEKLEEKKAS
jgi:hypothetical protein